MSPEVRPALLRPDGALSAVCVVALLLLLHCAGGGAGAEGGAAAEGAAEGAGAEVAAGGAAAAEGAGAAPAERGEQALPGSRLDHVESYELTYPRWLHPRVRNIRSSRQQFPSKTEVVITAEGQQLRLHLEQNEQLLAPGYQEVWYTAAGSRRSSTPGHTGHCFYHGEVQGVEASSVAVSTCAGLRGLISLNASVSYVVEPLPVAKDTWSQSRSPPHAVFRAESLRMRNGSCLHHHGNQEHEEESLDRFLHGMMTEHRVNRERRDLGQGMKYVELLLVADHAEFQKHGSDLVSTKMKLMEVANMVDKYYRALSIRVALIRLEVWSDRDHAAVSDNPYSTLGAFLAWRRKQLRTLPNDNAQLITGMSFQGTTIGPQPPANPLPATSVVGRDSTPRFRWIP